MTERHTVHFIEASSALRAEFARKTLALGHHAEVYADLEELAMHPPRRGVVVMRPPEHGGSFGDVIEQLTAVGVWLPVVAMGEDPSTAEVVTAIKAGALDFLALPLETDQLAAMLSRIDDEAREMIDARRRMVEARSRIGHLSAREREVLDWLARGSSNKAIARALEISPRTVEIHRANMMTKLGANHAAEAVRLRIEARLDEAA